MPIGGKSKRYKHSLIIYWTTLEPVHEAFFFTKFILSSQFTSKAFDINMCPSLTFWVQMAI